MTGLSAGPEEHRQGHDEPTTLPSRNPGRSTRRGYTLHRRGDLVGAIRHYRAALAGDPTRFDTWYALGCAELDRGHQAEAIDCLRRALALRPGHARVQLDLGRALFAVGEIPEAIESLRAAADEPELRLAALARIARYIPGSPRADNAAVLAARSEWADAQAQDSGALTAAAVAARQWPRKLRIGYVSAFFEAQNWMRPVWGVINLHDRAGFDIHLLCDGDPPGASSGYRAQAGDQIQDISKLRNREAADLVARLGIDILIDLNGYSFQDRLDLFRLRPAPVNIGWFNMYATTGIAAFDYIIGDDVVIPAVEEPFYSETVLRVPGSYLAFSTLYPTPAVAPAPSLQLGRLTFGSFASQYKLVDEVISAWAEILRLAADSRLILKNRTLGQPGNQAYLRERFRRLGISGEQLILEGPADHYDFLAAYDRIDIALDTFPYSGGTTTAEALWQGVPVLSFAGDRWASRTTASLLRAAGLDDWCMPDRDAYIRRAAELATEAAALPELARLRDSMRMRLLQAPICDSRRLCQSLETIYRRVATSLPGRAR